MQRSQTSPDRVYYIPWISCRYGKYGNEGLMHHRTSDLDAAQWEFFSQEAKNSQKAPMQEKLSDALDTDVARYGKLASLFNPISRITKQPKRVKKSRLKNKKKKKKWIPRKLEGATHPIRTFAKCDFRRLCILRV
jgi:hypothetical protein